MLKSFFYSVQRNAPDFYVQLYGCDSVFCAGALEVHIAEVVLKSLDVRQNPVFFVVSHH